MSFFENIRKKLQSEYIIVGSPGPGRMVRELPNNFYLDCANKGMNQEDNAVMLIKKNDK